MKTRGILALILIACWFEVAPAYAHDCCHHGDRDADCCDRDGDCCHRGQTGTQTRDAGPASGVVNLETANGKITEIVYLPAVTPDKSMVEIHLQSAGQPQLVRLAPVGFLKHGGLLLREGDAITVKGYAVAGMDGDLLVATEVHNGDKALSLRDTRGRPDW